MSAILTPFFLLFFSLSVSSQTAVGLFNSEVKSHLLLFANRGSKEYTELKTLLGALAPDFTGKVKIFRNYIHPQQFQQLQISLHILEVE